MATGNRPAFYALAGAKGWQDYLNLLHVPYTLWHLAYVVLGAAIAPTVHVDRLVGTVLAFFLAVGIASHALDELKDRPLGTKIPPAVLVSLAAVSLAGAVALGVVAGLLESRWVFAFVAFGGLIVAFYNLGLWNNRFHTDYWVAFSWGAFPVLTSYWVNASRLDIAVVLLAVGFMLGAGLATPAAAEVDSDVQIAQAPAVTLLCGRYEGVDERVIEARGLEEVSLGDFVLSGGEPAAIALIDACVRLLPGVLGNALSLVEESFERGLLEYPHYTRPQDWRGRKVPETLLSGHHEKIRAWRLAEAEKITRERRPDLWARYTTGNR